MPRARAIRLDPTIVGMAALTVFAFVVRFTQIHQSLFGDEVWTYQDIYGRSLRAVLTNVHTGGENSPPLFFLFAYATAKLGDPTVWIRLPSIVLGAATIPVTYLIGRETVGRVPGLVASAVLALSPFTFFYGVEARPYASMGFFVAVSTLAVLRAVTTGRAAWWVTYVIAAVAAAYCHYTCIFVLAVQGAWSVWACRDRVRVPLIAGAAAVLLYAPWLPKLRGKELAVIGALHPLTAHNVLTDLPRPLAGDPNAPLAAIPTQLGLILIAACVLAGVVALIRRARLPTRFPLLLALALASPVGLLLYSMAATDLWLPRGLYASIPTAALVLGTLLAAIPRPLNVAAVVIVLGTLGFGTIRDASPSWRRPPFRSLSSYLDRAAPATDPLAIVSFIGGPAIVAQLKQPHHGVTLPVLWRDTPPGGDAFLVEDTNFARARHLAAVPRPPQGFTVVGRRRYFSAVMPSEVVTYHREG
jgi:hypothetical protein